MATMASNGNAAMTVPAEGRTAGPGLAKAEEPSLALQPGMPPWMPRNMKQIGQLALKVVESGLVPTSVMRAPSPQAAALVIIMTGLELGLGVMQSLRHIHVIEGKPSLSSGLIVARVKRSPVCRYFRIVKSTNEECICETWRDGEPEPTRFSWSIEDARRADLLTEKKPNWKRYPRAMLRNRCQADLARAVYPDLVDGLYDPDELGVITTEDGEIIEVRAEPQRGTPPPSAPRSEPRPVDLDILLKDFERRIGEVVTSNGTTADLKAIGAEVGKSPLDEARREHLDQIYVLAMEAIEQQVAS